MHMVRHVKTVGYCTYFKTALLLGFSKHVYELSNKWGEAPSANASLAQYHAARYATKQLWLHHGYYVCPTCEWATRERYEHVRVLDSYCAIVEGRSANQRPASSDYSLDHEPFLDFEQCPNCGNILDNSTLEMHKIMGCTDRWMNA